MLQDNKRLIVLVALLASGCATLQRRPAQLVAPLGVQVLASVEAAQSAIIVLGNAGRIPPDQERPALEATVKAGHAGKRLALALRAIDRAHNAAARAEATEEAATLLEALRWLVFEVLAPFTDATVREQVGALLREVHALSLAISGAIVRAG